MSAPTSSDSPFPTINEHGRLRIALTLGFAVGQGVVLFGCAGRFDLPQGWLYLGLWLGCIVITGLLILARHPQLINQRGRPSTDAQTWDRIWIKLCGIAPFAVVAVAGLDRGRFGWSTIAAGWAVIGSLIFCGGATLVASAMLTNPFFETMVRIQTDREHRVESSGPYQTVRHPGYLGWILQYLSAPLILGSGWTFVPAGTMILLYLVRTGLEDHMLQTDLPGYGSYANEVRFRVIPGIW